MTEYAKQGYLNDALFNCIAMIGWNPADPGSPQELFTSKELISRFDFSRVQKSGAVFNIEKLNWYNREYLKKLQPDELISYFNFHMPKDIKDMNGYSQILPKIAPTLLERIEKGEDLTRLHTAGDLLYFFAQPEINPQKLIWKGLAEDVDSIQKTKTYLQGVLELITKDITSNTAEEWKTILFPYADANGRGEVLWPTRVALSGQEKSPDPFVLIGVLGKEESMSRITHAIELLSNES
jgi:glutamyl/glutaminyl-tRNA synthetase